MTERISAGGLQVAKALHEFIEDRALPGTGVASDAFWQGFGAVVTDLAPLNRALLARREQLQAQIDEVIRRFTKVASGIAPANLPAA